jgi:hypothetical protein
VSARLSLRGLISTAGSRNVVAPKDSNSRHSGIA